MQVFAGCFQCTDQKLLPQDNPSWPPITRAICAKCLQWALEYSDPRSTLIPERFSPAVIAPLWIVWHKMNVSTVMTKEIASLRAFIDLRPLGAVSLLSVNRNPSLSISPLDISVGQPVSIGIRLSNYFLFAWKQGNPIRFACFSETYWVFVMREGL